MMVLTQDNSITHLVWPHQPENPPGRPRTRRISPWRSPFLFYSTILQRHWCWKHLPPSGPADSIYYSIWKKYLQQNRVHRNLTNFLKCHLIPLVLSARVKNSFNFNVDSPLHILKPRWDPAYSYALQLFIIVRYYILYRKYSHAHPEDWNPKDNMLACLKVEHCLLWMLKVFGKLLVNNAHKLY